MALAATMLYPPPLDNAAGLTEVAQDGTARGARGTHLYDVHRVLQMQMKYMHYGL